MRTKIMTASVIALILSACSKNDQPANTKPADYAETREKLISTQADGSQQKDSSDVSTAMPAQPKASENGH